MATDKYEYWQDPLATRYATVPMRKLFSEQNRISTWRRVWLALAEAQRELGLTDIISQEALDGMQAHLEDIDFDAAAAKEREIRHDVMAHVHAFSVACPEAAGIIHLGATSEFINGNTDLILQRDALKLVKARLVTVMQQLADSAKAFADVTCLGYTHFQVAQPTTVGKRLTLVLQDFLMDLERLEDLEARFMTRGAKGTVGTQASFYELFKDKGKVAELDRRVAEKLGFTRTFPVTGQTYTRKYDVFISEVLAGIAGSAQKFAVDLRLLSHLKEMEEPFARHQTGSSAMVYKRNPMRSERVTSLARKLAAIPMVLRETQSNQWFERTLDDSAVRRLEIPQSFLLADSILNLLQNITSGLVVHHEVVQDRLNRFLPFLATEAILMLCAQKGKSRQDMHERLKVHAKTAWDAMIKTGDTKIFSKMLDEDPEVPVTAEAIDALLAEPAQFAGLAPDQTRAFVAAVEEKLAPYQSLIGKFGDQVSV